MVEARTQHAQHIRHQYSDFYRISGGLLLVILGIWIGSLIYSDGYATNVYTEILGVVATILVLDQFNQWRDRQALRRRLEMEVRSPAHDTAVTAMEWLRREDWLPIDTFQGQTLERVNWNGAYLGDLNFEGATFRQSHLIQITNNQIKGKQAVTQPINFTNTYFQRTVLDGSRLITSDFSSATFLFVELQNTNLTESIFRNSKIVNSNFTEATLFSCDFSDASIVNSDFTGCYAREISFRECQFDNTIFYTSDLITADLSGAKLIDCNCRGIRLRFANLTGANLSGADLTGAELQNADLTDTIWATYPFPTILPDGTAWNPLTDMRQYTNRTHPDFTATLERINIQRAEMSLTPLT